MIEVRGLTVEIGGRRLLSDVDLRVSAGEAVALSGPNGAGKTTLLRCLLGLVPCRGDVRIGGFDVVRDPVRAKRSLGYVPQVPAHLEDTARGALRFVAALRAAHGEDVDVLLARVGLADAARKPVRTFSTGMKQRLSLAAALVGSPQVLVLDEPTAALDKRGQEDFARLLREMHAGGCTILLCSHRESEVRSVADRVVQIEDGRIVGAGAAALDALDARHALPAVRAFA